LGINSGLKKGGKIRVGFDPKGRKIYLAESLGIAGRLGKENKWTHSIAVGSKTFVENMKDRELLKRFEEIDKLNVKEKGAIKEILDT